MKKKKAADFMSYQIIIQVYKITKDMKQDVTLIRTDSNKEQHTVTANQSVIQILLSVRIQKWPMRTPDYWHLREIRMEGNKHLLELYLLYYFI